MPDTQVYKENDNFVPDPTAQFGTVDTSGTAGAAHGKIEEVSPVFAIADAQVAARAARALDPDDDAVPASLVVLPDSERSREDAEKAVKARAEKTSDKEPAELVQELRVTPAEAEAADEGEEAAAKAEAAQRNTAGSAGGGLDGSGTGTTVEKDEDTKSSSKSSSKSKK